MKACLAALVVGLLLLASGGLLAQPPDEFGLYQNDPNPFCPGGAGGYTDIRMTLPQQAVILMKVWSPDTTVVVRTLIYGVLPAGFHSVIWDGRDGHGSILPDGDYPYSMTASDQESCELLFYEVLVATIDCVVATRPTAWGTIKSEFER